LQCRRLMLSAIVLGIMISPVLIDATGDVTNAYAQYATDGQYPAQGQYGAIPQYASDGQYQAATPSCQQNALDALSRPGLRTNSQATNLQHLSRYIQCGGTISSLPKGIFDTLVVQGVITLNRVNDSTFACPNGDSANCSDITGTPAAL
jgi:hypothetical protein